MAKVQQSRFALLQVEDDDSDDGRPKSKSSQGNKAKEQQQKNAQKKNKKKKQQQHQAENEELKHLAFGAPTRHHTHSTSSDHGRSNGNHVAKTQQQWNEWQKTDAEFTADSFERDLEQALLLSRLENEKDKQKPSPVSPEDHAAGGDGKASKKKKKKDKPQPMSLDQFNKKDEEKKFIADELDDVQPPSPTTKIPATECDQKFFKKVDDDVSRIIRQEKMQEEYKKQYAAESVITAKYQEKISKMEKEIEFLRATMKKQEEELKQVKKRNKQLCVILAQGEMKDKSEVLQQVNQLTEVKDELTEQVSSLTGDLEKERSKVHTLKAELDKYKNGKHK